MTGMSRFQKCLITAVIAVRDDYRDLLQLVGTDDNAIQHNGGGANTMVRNDGSRLKRFTIKISRSRYITWILHSPVFLDYSSQTKSCKMYFDCK
jgi:hypothetical protein